MPGKDLKYHLLDLRRRLVISKPFHGAGCMKTQPKISGRLAVGPVPRLRHNKLMMKDHSVTSLTNDLVHLIRNQWQVK